MSTEFARRTGARKSGETSRPRATLTSEAEAPSIRVLIADDHSVVRDGLRALLDAEDGMSCVGEAADGREAVTIASGQKPDVLLLDFRMPGPTALETIKRISRASPSTRVVMFTAALERGEMVALLGSGASGVVLKESPTPMLFKAIRCVHSGEVWVGRSAIVDIVAALGNGSAAFDDNGSSTGNAPRTDALPRLRLSPREREIVAMIVEGDTNKGIAARLSIGEDTVKHHLTNIFNKTGASNRLELALFALHHKLVQPQDPQ